MKCTNLSCVGEDKWVMRGLSGYYKNVGNLFL